MTEVMTYGAMPDGRPVKCFTLRDVHGMVAKVIEYGAILESLRVPASSGGTVELTLGFDSLAGWLSSTAYFGATVGRFANRIAHGQFVLDGKRYALATNDRSGTAANHLHGGTRGFDKVLWSGEAVQRPDAVGVRFSYVSPDGEEGYPGALTVKVTYWLTDDNELVWEAQARTDKPTIVNLAQHAYWNLSGEPTRTIEDHVLTINADRYLPTDAGLIPSGQLAPVSGTPLDFRKPTAIGARINEPFETLQIGGGYDHTWVLNAMPNAELHHAATLFHPSSGRSLELRTDQPALQFYSGNLLNGFVAGRGGVCYPFRSGLCLETERFPDAPNHVNFPSAELLPGDTYRHTLALRFKF
jgi:aldose 1-epimerase